jgi:hypothetical protein
MPTLDVTTLSDCAELQWGELSEPWLASEAGYERLYAACRDAVRREIVNWFQARGIGVPNEIENDVLSISCLRQILTDLRKPKPALKPKQESTETRFGSQSLLGTMRQRKQETYVYFSRPKPYIEEIQRCPSCNGTVIEKSGELRCGSGCGWTNTPVFCSGQFPDPNYKVVWSQPQISSPIPPMPPKGSGWYQLGSGGITDPLTTLASDTHLRVPKKASKERLNEFLTECEWRKNHFWNWREILRAELRFGEFSCEAVSNSTEDGRRVENLSICPRCGGTCFNRQMRCVDCKLKWHPEWHLPDRATVDQKIAAQEGLPETISMWGSNRCRRKLTPEEFLAGLLLRGTVKKLRHADELVKAAGSYLILVEQWLPEDVQEFVCGDSEETIKKRADRLYSAVYKHLESGKLLPECNITEFLDAESILRLKGLLVTLIKDGKPQADEFRVFA